MCYSSLQFIGCQKCLLYKYCTVEILLSNLSFLSTFVLNKTRNSKLFKREIDKFFSRNKKGDKKYIEARGNFVLILIKFYFTSLLE